METVFVVAAKWLRGEITVTQKTIILGLVLP